MIIVKSREEVSVLRLFSQEEYNDPPLNREQKWDLALKEGWKFSVIRGKFIKEVKY